MVTKRILHIEDNASNRKAVRHILRRTNYELVEAISGEDGLARAQAELPDLILLDIQLPKLSGYDVAKELRSNDRTRTIPIIAVTSYALSGDEPRAFESGCDDYISKPYRPSILLEHLDKHLRGSDE